MTRNANLSLCFLFTTVMLSLDWNTLIVGKLSPWIDADSEIETERRNSEAVSSSLWTISLRYPFSEAIVDVVAGEGSLISRFCSMSELSPCVIPPCPHHSSSCVSLQALVQELNFSAYLGLPVFMIPLKGPHNANLARLLLNHIHTGHHTSNVRCAAFKKKTQHAHVACF